MQNPPAPHLHCGGEYGRGWREAGRLLSKENTITHFIDCAQLLVTAGNTLPGKLVGVGGSAGAIPVGGALVRRPGLWAAMVITVPVLNSQRVEFSETAHQHPELGSVRTRDGLHSLICAFRAVVPRGGDAAGGAHGAARVTQTPSTRLFVVGLAGGAGQDL
jgi:hypothetical protein